jgi:transposase InsO family protein
MNGRGRASCSTSISSRWAGFGKRAIACTAIANSTRGAVAGEYVHVAIDDHSRLAYVEVLPEQTGPLCAAFLDRAVAWFGGRQVTCERVMSDNGSGYISRVFAERCQALGVRHLRTRPYTPRTNGKAERFIQTLQREWAYRRAYRTSHARRRALRPWLHYYNQQRPHASLNYQPPITRLTCAA